MGLSPASWGVGEGGSGAHSCRSSGCSSGHPESIPGQLHAMWRKGVHAWECDPRGFREAGKLGVQARAVCLWGSPLSPHPAVGLTPSLVVQASPHLGADSVALS